MAEYSETNYYEVQIDDIAAGGGYGDLQDYMNDLATLANTSLGNAERAEAAAEDARASKDYLEDLKNGITPAVNNWLDAHPEATTTVLDDSLTTAKYKDSSITTDKVHDGAITTDKVQDLAITADKIHDGAITADKYEDGSITRTKIANDTVYKINGQPLRTSLNDMTVMAQETCYFVKDTAHHIAFPSVYYDSQLYLAYRRGTEHASYDGEIVIKRGSETSLSDYGVISVSGKDCRDPKLVEFNGTVYCLFSAREAGQYAKAYACQLSDLSNPVEINAYFIGGQPFVDGSTIYIPCYRDNDVYLAYGDNLFSLEVRRIAVGGNECAITKVDDTFIIIYRDADDSKNGHIIRTKTLDKYEICEFPINAHCPCLYQIGGGSFTYNYLLFSCRSWNRTQNVNNYEGQLDLFLMGTDGEFVSPRINLFAGNNKDVGYTSICRKGSSSTVIIAYYLDFIDSIVVMTAPYARVYYHQLYGDIVYRDISRAQIYFSSSGKKYKIRAPLGTNRIIGLRTSIPTDTPSVLTSNHIYVRSFKTGDVAVEDTLIAVGGGSTLAVDAKMICLQNKFNTPSDYSAALNTDGTFIEIT